MSPPAKTPAATVPETLDAVLAFDRLEVGPVILEPDRLRMPYRVLREGMDDSFELTYRYPEPVFAPDAPDDRNLASMIGAQVAVNYGLCCREIVFHGPFDPTDRRFLERMIENTAREIYVNKLLRPNPFLLPPADRLPAVPRPRYSQALLRFESADPPAAKPAAWTSDPTRWCVLSSGGKDSLLTYGLLDELGYETHPIFVNESGRHWLTALDAYRWFASEVPSTGRVWTNCDRLYTFMLRRLPFIRPDFANRRADIYPFRLWTVAVFLFGVLPLLRKRQIGMLAIGDEYDTTVRSRFSGIPHHDGLYDQSRYFDQTLSRFFRRKGWAITQLSLLRPMSELLIEKVLAERYPQLLEHQVSCHAAHSEGERVRPCSRCEKCRRIASMLLAIGVDPAACGYAAEQREALIAEIARRGFKLEPAAAAWTVAALHERGVLETPRLGEIVGRKDPNALALRFHPERSPAEDLPADLRAPLLRILLEHAEGARRRAGRAWVLLEPENDPVPGADPPKPSGESFLWGELNWPQAEARLATVDIALLPVGAIEQHGRHLPLDVDSFDADYLARRVAEACRAPRPLVLPLVPYGVSYHHQEFKGTLSISNETLSRLIYDIGMSAARNGITKLVIINGHGGNDPTLHFAAQTINRDARIFCCVESGETSDSEIDAMTDAHNDVHAGDIETSTTLAVRPHLVDMSAAVRADAPFSSHYLDFTSHQAVGWYARTERISPSGVLGDPTRATREKGERMWKVMIENLVELVDHLKDLSLDEIHQRRY